MLYIGGIFNQELYKYLKRMEEQWGQKKIYAFERFFFPPIRDSFSLRFDKVHDK